MLEGSNYCSPLFENCKKAVIDRGIPGGNVKFWIGTERKIPMRTLSETLTPFVGRGNITTGKAGCIISAEGITIRTSRDT